MEFAYFLRNLFLNFPVTKEAFLENPYPVVISFLVLIMLIKRKVAFLFYFLIALIIFLAGLYYGIVNPVASDAINIAIFAGCSIVAIGLILFRLLIKTS